jgi:hypothetical protein
MLRTLLLAVYLSICYTEFTAAFTSSTAKKLNDVLVVVAWDNCLADSVDWRIQTGIDTACRVWPHLLQTTTLEGTSISDPSSWLHQKLRAISHVLSPSSFDDDDHTASTSSLTCEYALAARLLLEEQALDQGKSTGRTGKYASRFHPRDSTTTTTTTDTQSSYKTAAKPSSSTRPLTVGEITTNWNQGGMIRDSLLVRYCVKQSNNGRSVTYQNPMTALQTAWEQQLESPPQHEGNPVWKAQPISISPSLLRRRERSKVIATVHHRSDLEIARASLEAAGWSVRVLHDKDLQREALLKDTLPVGRNESSDPSSITLVVGANDLSLRLLQELPDDATLYMVDSCLDSLQELVHLFGDFIPRTSSGVAKTIVPHKQLALLLLCGPHSHPMVLAAGMMHAWMRCVGSLEELKEHLQLV